MQTKNPKKTHVNIVTLGCSKNWVDSENILTQLKANEIAASHESENSEAEVVVINTCGFIENAKEESIETILQYAEAKEAGLIEKVYVTGCLSERYKSDLEKEIPQVDAYFGTRDLPLLLKKFRADYKHELVGERLLTTPRHYAYLKISEGCDRPCSFCAIPLMRGKHQSTPIETLVQQATNFAKNGTKEILLIAQDLTYYGLDLYKKRNLAELLENLAQVEGIDWIRLHYAYPSGFPLDVLEVMKKYPNICNYLDMPLQHASSEMLKSMRRGINRERTQDLIDKVRSDMPELALRTTMIVGYPNETDADFQELCDFVEKNRFERLGIFQYSHEEDTHAFQLEDNIPKEIKQERADILMEIQQDISVELNQAKIGKTFQVMIDRKEGGYFVGRTEFDSPEVDNEVLIPAEDIYLPIGDFCQVTITGASEFDLFGEVN